VFDQFRYVTLEVTMTAEEAAKMPPYKGSTLRGAFGHAFRRVACPFRACPPCILPKTCPFTYVFESPPRDGGGLFGKNAAVPHPFILELPMDGRTEFQPGDRLTFGLVLIGRAIDFTPYFAVALREMGRAGLGRGRARWRLGRIEDRAPGAGRLLYNGATEDERLLCFPSVLRGVDCIAWTHGPISLSSPPAGEASVYIPPLPPVGEAPPIAPSPPAGQGRGEGDFLPNRITLRFETPTRLRYGGHLTDKLEFHVLIRNLLRRLTALAIHHCDFIPEVDHRALIRQAEAVATRTANLRWMDWERYSARQDARMTLGGFVGAVTFEGDLAPFGPLLRLGEIVHVGKGTSFGLGKYRMVAGEATP
jgi:hypothetical protein